MTPGLTNVFDYGRDTVDDEKPVDDDAGSRDAYLVYHGTAIYTVEAKWVIYDEEHSTIELYVVWDEDNPENNDLAAVFPYGVTVIDEKYGRRISV